MTGCADRKPYLRVDDVMESLKLAAGGMIGLLCFALAVLASPFKSKLRLEAENAVVCTEKLNPDVVAMKSAKDRI